MDHLVMVRALLALSKFVRHGLTIVGLSEESGKKDHPYMKRKSISTGIPLMSDTVGNVFVAVARRRIVPQKNPSYPPYYVNKGGNVTQENN